MYSEKSKKYIGEHASDMNKKSTPKSKALKERAENEKLHQSDKRRDKGTKFELK
jgi:hypothetical protein